MVFETAPWSLEEVLQRIYHDVDKWGMVHCGRLGGESREWLKPRWVASPKGCIKVNIDCRFRREKRWMGAGRVCSDAQGKWLCGFMNASQGGSAFVAGAIALRDGL